MTVAWDPAQYLRFADARSRPFLDLVARVPGSPRSIVDLGCGPGHLTPVLRSRWPDATVHGIDSSPAMIEQAVRADVDVAVTYEVADVATWDSAAPVDLLVSNALFQWVPDQLDVIERLSAQVEPGGTFALQVPRNDDRPSHTLLREIAGQTPFAAHTADVVVGPGTDPMRYLDLFASLGWEVDVWETTYVHVLDGDDAVLEWMSGTGARPYVQALPERLRGDFLRTYGAALRGAYPRRPGGTPFPFRRTFVVARRGA